MILIFGQSLPELFSSKVKTTSLKNIRLVLPLYVLQLTLILGVKYQVWLGLIKSTECCIDVRKLYKTSQICLPTDKLDISNYFGSTIIMTQKKC